MRLGVLPILVAGLLLLAACSDDDTSDDTSFLAEKNDPTDTRKRVFDDAALEGPDGIQKILTEEYKVENVESVSCPADQEVKVGYKFTCTVKQGGDDPKDLTVEITVTSDEGQYQVALPEESK
jgi:hypothetical protein